MAGVSVGSNSKTGEKFTFFFGKNTVFSQWHSASFKVEGVEYGCAEQYMMHQKAVLFKDKDMAAKILDSHDPKEQKAMGRRVSNFDEKVWKQNCKEIVKRGNEAKFSQNPELKRALLSTMGTSLVEASPRDRVWGIGMGAKNPKATQRTLWRGSNWLGEILTQVREDMEAETSAKK